MFANLQTVIRLCVYAYYRRASRRDMNAISAKINCTRLEMEQKDNVGCDRPDCGTTNSAKEQGQKDVSSGAGQGRGKGQGAGVGRRDGSGGGKGRGGGGCGGRRK